jgi:hypothetical protein
MCVPMGLQRAKGWSRLLCCSSCHLLFTLMYVLCLILSSYRCSDTTAVYTRSARECIMPLETRNVSGFKIPTNFRIEILTHIHTCIYTGPPLWSSGKSSWLQNGDVLCFLWGSDSSWLEIQRSGFDSRRYQISWQVVGLERGTLSPVSTTEELLERKSSCSGLENREYDRGDPLRWPLCWQAAVARLV